MYSVSITCASIALPCPFQRICYAGTALAASDCRPRAVVQWPRLRHILESVPSRILVAALTAKPPAAWLRLRAGTSQLDSWMSALGHKRTLERFRPMSAIPPKADISRREMNVRFVKRTVARLLDHLIGA